MNISVIPVCKIKKLIIFVAQKKKKRKSISRHLFRFSDPKNKTKKKYACVVLTDWKRAVSAIIRSGVRFSDVTPPLPSPRRESWGSPQQRPVASSDPPTACARLCLYSYNARVT